jgi:transcription initiation factor TFIIB
MNSKLDSLQVERCLECGSSLLIQDSKKAEIVCGKCGFVVTTGWTDKGPEYRTFTPEDHKKRPGLDHPKHSCS